MKTILFNVWDPYDSTRPQGVYRIATILRKNGWDVEVIEFFNHWNQELLKYYIKSKVTKETKFVGFSFLYAVYNVVFTEFVRWFKSNYPHITIITGSNSNFEKDFELVDYHVHGFGEIAVIELLKYLFSNGSKPKFNLLQSNNHTKRIDANVFYQAFPMKELMIEYTDNDFLQSDEWLSIETSRGCIFQCDFCNYPVLGVKGDYTRSVEDFELQLRTNYDKYGITNYNLTDETFNDSTNKIVKYANVVDTLPFQPAFCACLRPELLVTRPDDREHLLRMGIYFPFFGIESFNHEARKSIGKGMHPDKVKTMLLDFKDFYVQRKVKNFRANISLIAGLPGETIESFNDSIEWLKENWKNHTAGAHPLSMNDNDLTGKISKMASNYQKYGYERMTKEEIQVRKKDIKYHRGYLQKNNLIWKNKNMDYIDAINLSGELTTLWGTYLHNIGDYTIGSLALEGSVEDRLKFADFDVDILHRRVRQYVNNKFNARVVERYTQQT